MFGTIVIPYDGSESATRAFRYADLLHSQNVRLVRVEPPFQVLAPGPLENFRPDWRTVRTAQIQQELAPFVERFESQGRNVELVVRFGDPATEIIESGEGADLIIMTTQGRGTAGRALFGSVADRVSRHGATPTLLVRVGAAQPDSRPIDRIVVPLDGSPLAEQALPLAVTLATDLALPMRVLRIVDPYQIAREMPSGSQQHDAPSPADAEAQPPWEHAVTTAMAYLEGIAEPLRARGLTVTAEAQVGAAVPLLLDELRADDMVVMTTHGRGGLQRWLLGSVAEQVVRAAAGPVLLARAPAAASSQSAIDDLPG